MALMQEYGFTVRPDREGDFQEWLRCNEEQLRSAVPASIRYVGTYGVAFSSEKDAGSHRLFLEFDSYGSIDAFSAAMKDSGSEFARLMREYYAFVADDPAPSSLSLYRSFTDMFV